MSSPESKELMKLFKCSTDIATQVVCAFVDTKVLPQHGGSFYKYLEDEKHFFYHQWEKKKIACCDCPAAGCTIHRVKKMENWMFNTFYDDTGHVHRNHFLKTGQTTQQICLHKYVARNIRLDNLDITILCFILLCSGTLTVTEKLAVETIQNKRNMICHTWSTKCFSMTQLNDIWTEIESAACSLTNPYMRHIIQSQIQSIKQCDIEKEEITLLTSKIDEINALLEEVNRKIPINSNTNIEDKLTQLYVRKTEDIKQHTSQHVNQVQQALSKEIKETAQKERKELEVSFRHMIDNLSMSVKYDRQVNVLVPQDMFKGPLERPVLWQFATPPGWDIEEVEAKLTDPLFQDEMVKIKFVKRGSLIMMTTISATILIDQKAFETAVKSFLNKLVEVCHINTKVHAKVSIRIHLLDPSVVQLSFEDPNQNVQRENKLSQTDMTALDIDTMKTKRNERKKRNRKYIGLLSIAILMIHNYSLDGSVLMMDSFYAVCIPPPPDPPNPNF
ncbi:uncharacterized protein [Mytilus edulis]